MFLRVIDLCKQVPRIRVQIVNASTGEVLFEGALEDCPYRVCEMEIEKMESQNINRLDYLIFAE